MTTSGFVQVARALETWPDLPPLSGALTAPYQRLLDAICLSAAKAGSAGERDLAALVRQVLRHETSTQGADQHLLVPTGAGWPTIEHWLDADCSALPAVGGRFIVSASGWRP